MSVTIRARVIRNKYPKNNSLTVTLEDAQSGKSFTNFESFTGDASTIALYFASSIFADSTPRPSSFLLDSLNFTFGLLRLNSNNFRQERQGKILMTEEEATNNVKELKKINKTIIENLGDIKLGKLLTELKSKNAISIGDKSEDILSLETFNKINKTNKVWTLPPTISGASIYAAILSPDAAPISINKATATDLSVLFLLQ